VKELFECHMHALLAEPVTKNVKWSFVRGLERSMGQVEIVLNKARRVTKKIVQIKRGHKLKCLYSVGCHRVHWRVLCSEFY
jgi:hypothetical protein